MVKSVLRGAFVAPMVCALLLGVAPVAHAGSTGSSKSGGGTSTAGSRSSKSPKKSTKAKKTASTKKVSR